MQLLSKCLENYRTSLNVAHSPLAEVVTNSRPGSALADPEIQLPSEEATHSLQVQILLHSVRYLNLPSNSPLFIFRLTPSCFLVWKLSSHTLKELPNPCRCAFSFSNAILM